MNQWLPNGGQSPFEGIDRTAPLPPSRKWTWWQRRLWWLGERIQKLGRIVQGWGS